MAERNNKLILPDFFGSKGGLLTSSSIVNTTDPLQPGETLFEKDTGQFKTNLSSSTLPYSQSGYAGNAIRFDSLAELKTYDYPHDYQLVHTITPQSFFYYDPTDTTSPNNDSTVIVSNGGKRYKIFSPVTSFTGLPTSDPGTTGVLYTTGSDFLGGPAGKKVLMIS